MSVSIFVVTAIIVIVFVLIINGGRKKKNLPPGPIVWPVIGNSIELKLTNAKYPHLALAQLAKKYGPVMGIGIGMNYSVVISGYEEMKELLSKPEISESRYQFPYVEDRNFHKNLGLIWATGDVWREMRSFTFNTIQKYSFDESGTMDAVFKAETNALSKHIRTCARSKTGVWEVDSDYLIQISVNIIWGLVSGYRFSHDSEHLREYLKLNNRLVNIFGQKNLYAYFPFLKQWFPKLVQHDEHMRTHQDLQMWAKSLINDAKSRRLARLNPKSVSFVELVLEKVEENSGTSSNFTEEQLVIIILDLLFAGSEPMIMTLNWAVLFLCLNPDSQQKLQKEIQQNNSISHPNTPPDAAKFPYLRATVLELFRLGNTVPVPGPRVASEDVLFREYLIPKGSAIFANTMPVFMDEKFWGDPAVFRPERFLDSTGNIAPKVAKRMAIFGFGTRSCPGDLFAMNTLLVFMIALFGSFTFETIPGKEPSAEDPIPGVRIKPRKYAVRVRELQTDQGS